MRPLCVSDAHSCLTLCSPTDCSPPGSCVHGILQAGILEWVAIPFSRESSWPRIKPQVSCIAGGFFTNLRHFGKWLMQEGRDLMMRLIPSEDETWENKVTSPPHHSLPFHLLLYWPCISDFQDPFTCFAGRQSNLLKEWVVLKLIFPRFKTWFGPCLSQIGLPWQTTIEWVA